MKNEKQYSHGKRLICAAFFEILKYKRYDLISVSEICDKAGVVRKTFYNNFDTKEDIVRLGIDIFLDSAEIFKNLLEAEPEDVYFYIFHFVYENKEMFSLLHGSGLFQPAEEKLIQYLYASNLFCIAEPELLDSPYLKYIIGSTVSIFVSILTTWIKTNYCETPCQIARLTEKLLVDLRRIKNVIKED